MNELWQLGAAESARRISEGTLTSEALTRACLERVAAREASVRAFVDLKPEAALTQARACDQHRPKPHELLYGVPVAVKEVFDVAGYRCGWGTPIHQDRVPAGDAAAVERLKRAGAVIVGTTVSTEYAIAAAGPTTNPHDATRTPGGSSSGSAAAVAAGMVPLALGSQSIGSTVRPSVYCGVYGLKPTRGAISTVGGMQLAEFLDHPGVIARSPEDIALGCRVLFGRDPRDPGSVEVAPPALNLRPAGLKVLELIGPLAQRVQPASEEARRRAVRVLRAAGVPVRQVTLPEEFEQLPWVIDVILCRGIARHHGADRDRAGNLMSERLRYLVDHGRQVSDVDLERGMALARRYTERLDALLEGNTLILTVATDGVAPPLTEGTGSPLLQGLPTVAGLPALAVPCGKMSGLPIGVQLIGARGREDLVLGAAASLPPVG